MKSSIKNDEANWKNDGHYWACPVGHVIRRLLQTPSDPSFFTGKLHFGMQIRRFLSSVYSDPSFFQSTLVAIICPSFFQNPSVLFSKPCPWENPHFNNFLWNQDYWGSKMESWQCFLQCWHKRIWCNTSSFGCAIPNFVNPNIVKNLTISWLLGQT